VLDQGREAYARSAWAQAYESLARADELEPLAAADLELLSISAYMLGREDDCRSFLERQLRSRHRDGSLRVPA
jgi:hypothetical protein